MSKNIEIDFTPLNDMRYETMNLNTLYQLDSEFDQHLANMKKYILELKEKKSKQLCALWIKKLCEISDTGDMCLDLKNLRNMYSARLLYILENCDNLQTPFNERPPNDSLKPLEDLDIKTARSVNNKQQETSTHTEIPIHRNLKTDLGMYTLKHDFPADLNLDTCQFMNNFNQNSFITKIQEEKTLKTNFECQLRMLEAKFKEEKCYLQQIHTNEIQKILDRKNNELESLKSNFGKKKKDYEENVHTLEKKIQTLQKEIGTQRDENEVKFNEYKLRIDSIYEKRFNETEKKFTEMINKYEKDKFEMQIQHAKAFQDLVDETNVRLKKVEFEYNEQQNINDKVIIELENRTNLLKAEMEKNIMLIKTLEMDNKEKHSLIESLDKKLKDEAKKNLDLEHNLHRLKENYKKESETLNQKMQSCVNEKGKENDNLKKKMHNLKEEMANYKSEMDKKCENLNQIIKEKEGHLCNAMNTIKQQKLQAESALNELKKEIEANSTKLYEEMRQQMNKCENDLAKTKSSKEKQSKEYQKQLDEIKKDHKKDIENLLGKFENEKNKIKNEHNSDIDKILKNHENIYEQIQQQFQQQINENNKVYKQRIDETTKNTIDLENRIIQLEQELLDANTLRKHQIAELGQLREDEKNKINRNYESEIENLKIKIDQDELIYKKKLNELEERYEADLQRLQKQNEERVKKLNKTINELEEDLEKSKLEIRKLRDHLDKEKNNSFIRIEEEKNSVKKYCQNQISNLEKELHQEVIRYKNAEKKLRELSLEQDQYVTKLKMQYEEKLKGLLPNDAKKDYEETISALKNQIDSLQQRTILLQSELDERNQLVSSSETGSI
ncbi:unnamed protein product [Brachionus calyciflorus]|uniref:DUF4485 domain-containing protein n=1 Tax=Brachionus calyciflorus TaxID=104777 RepID=A0A814BZ50_9BILA|nr:unnamed protein product [Brachionus calyciflorus]